MPILKRYVPPVQPAAESSELAEFHEAIREERYRDTPAAPVAELKKYRNLQQLLDDVGHGRPVENRLAVPVDALPIAVRDLAARGLTDDSMMRELGVQSLETMQALRRHLRCEDQDDAPAPEAA